MKRRSLQFVGLFLSIALLSTLAVAPVTAQTDQEQFLVELDATGDAEMSLTFAYDLASEDEQAAFEEIQGNDSAQAAIAERFENRMATVAADASAATDRNMTVGNAALDLQQSGDVGLVTISIEWSNLAAVDGDRLTVTEPFASGFEPEQPLTVVAPEGFDVTQVTPEPASSDDGTATWERGTSLETFEFVAEESAEPTGSDGGPEDDAIEETPGFGVGVTLVALMTAAVGAGILHRR